MPQPPSGTVTFLFTDIEGSTRLWDDYPEVMRVALARHDEILRAAIDDHRGLVFSTGGDGVAAAFQWAGDALAAAVEAQRTLLAERWPMPVQLRVRMGLHTGEAHERDGDYFGPPVNRAARVMGAGHGGQVVVSSVTRDLVGGNVDVVPHDLGVHDLRGVAEPLHLFGVSADGLPWLDRPLVTAGVATRGKLPSLVSEWVGSVTELRRRADELPRRRLVTLTGAGGVGKTRTALEIAWLSIDAFPAGVWLVELAPVADPDAVIDAVASTMTIQPQPGMSTLDAILDSLRGRTLLLILDNCEHVISAVAELVAAIGSACETVTVLATSREPLGVAGERVAAVPSLRASDGIELFYDRARAADETVRFDDKELDAIGAICRRLDGIPLAIELAAARVRSLAPTELLPRLDDRFRLLRGAGRGGLERHQTLRATVEWSYQLLTETERMLFDRVSVFSGTFDLTAVEGVCADDTLDDLDVVGLLASLVDKSMVIADRTEIGTRYRLLETLRQFGEEHADARGETARLRDHHLGHYVNAAQRADQQRASPSQFTAEQILAAEWDNLRAALDWAITSRDLDAAQSIVATTGGHARARMRHEQGTWAQRCLEALDEESAVRPVTFGWAAYWKWVAGDSEAAARLAWRGIDAAPNQEHPDTALCWPLLIMTGAAFTDPPKTRYVLGRVAALSTTHPDPFTRAWVLNARYQFARAAEWDTTDIERVMTQLAEEVGAPSLRSVAAAFTNTTLATAKPPDPAALEAARTVTEQARLVGDIYWEGLGLNLYAVTAVLFATPDAAAACAESLRHLSDTRDWGHLYMSLGIMAEQPTDLAPVIVGYFDRRGIQYVGYYSRRTLPELAEQARRTPGGTDGIARGAAMDRDELIAYVLKHLEIS